MKTIKFRLEDSAIHEAQFVDPMFIRNCKFIMHDSDVSIYQDKYGVYYAIQCIPQGEIDYI